jgi:hypothetical protein
MTDLQLILCLLLGVGILGQSHLSLVITLLLSSEIVVIGAY